MSKKEVSNFSRVVSKYYTDEKDKLSKAQLSLMQKSLEEFTQNIPEEKHNEALHIRTLLCVEALMSKFDKLTAALESGGSIEGGGKKSPTADKKKTKISSYLIFQKIFHAKNKINNDKMTDEQKEAAKQNGDGKNVFLEQSKKLSEIWTGIKGGDKHYCDFLTFLADMVNDKVVDKEDVFRLNEEHYDKEFNGDWADKCGLDKTMIKVKTDEPKEVKKRAPVKRTKTLTTEEVKVEEVKTDEEKDDVEEDTKEKEPKKEKESKKLVVEDEEEEEIPKKPVAAATNRRRRAKRVIDDVEE